VIKLFKQVTDSTWLPMYDFDFWILPYLEGKGVSLEDIKRFVNTCNDLLAEEIGVSRGGALVDRASAESELRQICNEIRLKNFDGR
jgi:hypothetical protein